MQPEPDFRKPSITVMVPAFNESGNLGKTVKEVLNNLKRSNFSDYEILIIDCLDKNGADDGTSRIADELTRLDLHIKAIHNPYVNLGYKFWQGVSLAKMEYYIWIPGDGENNPAISELFAAAGKADLVIAYTLNEEVRPLNRRIISSTYTIILNTLFGLRLKYFNGTCVYKTDILRSLPNSTKMTRDPSFNAEILIKLLKRGHSYMEQGVHINPRMSGKAKTLNLRNLKDVAANMLKVFWEVRIMKAY